MRGTGGSTFLFFSKFVFAGSLYNSLQIRSEPATKTEPITFPRAVNTDPISTAPGVNTAALLNLSKTQSQLSKDATVARALASARSKAAVLIHDQRLAKVRRREIPHRRPQVHVVE